MEIPSSLRRAHGTYWDTNAGSISIHEARTRLDTLHQQHQQKLKQLQAEQELLQRIQLEQKLKVLKRVS